MIDARATVSKIYEALKKAEQERESVRSEGGKRPAALADSVDLASAVQEEYQKFRASLVSIAVPSGAVNR